MIARLRPLIVISLSLTAYLLFCQAATANPQQWKAEHLKHGQPIAQADNTTLIVREGYVLLHDNDRQIPLWVVYRLDPADLDPEIKRTDDFREDPAIIGERGELSDYKGTGYDRGHMAPAGDMKKSRRVMSESFFLSNIVPQAMGHNRGPWAKLEEQVRAWLKGRGQLWVYTGPVSDPRRPGATIGDGVLVPPYLWKIIVDELDNGNVTAIAYLMPNKKRGAFAEYVTTVDNIEWATGIDFLPGLPNNLEAVIESRVFRKHWDMAIEPSVRTVYITASGKNYHSGGCRYLSKSKIAISLKDAKAWGYTACSRCRDKYEVRAYKLGPKRPSPQPWTGAEILRSRNSQGTAPDDASRRPTSVRP